MSGAFLYLAGVNYLSEDEQALRDMTSAVVDKLDQMTDQQYSELMGEASM